jgi:hypothetical protein
MDQEQTLAAFFANLAYTDPSDREAQLKNAFEEQFDLDHDYSTDETFVAVERGGLHRVFIGHRGTANLEDVGTDFQLAFGNLRGSDRFRRAEALAQQAANDYADADIIQVGHSLGGTLADQISRDLGHRSITFNQGSSPFQHSEVSQEHQHIRTENDPVSQFNDSTVTIQQKSDPIMDRWTHARDQLGPLGFLLPNPTAIQTYEAFQSHLLKNFNV